MGISYVVDPSTNKSFFTYFSEFDKAWEKSYIVETVVLGTLVAISICGNVLVISFFARFSAIRQVTNLFITNLAVSDLIFSAMALLVMVTRVTGDWVLGSVPCHAATTVQFISGIVSAWTLVLISVDRRRAIVGSPQRKKATIKGAVVQLAVVWLGALLVTLPLAIFFKPIYAVLPPSGPTGTVRHVTVCSLDLPQIQLTIPYACANIVVVFIIPLTIIARNYHKVLKKFSSSRRRMRYHMESAPQSIRTANRAAANVQREARVIRMLVTMVVCFAAFWGLITLAIVVLMTDYVNQNFESYQITIIFTVTFAYSAINPVLYGILNEQYRSRFRELFCNIPCCRGCFCGGTCATTRAQQDHVGGGSVRRENGSSVRQSIHTLSGREHILQTCANGDACCQNNVMDNSIVSGETPP